MFTIKHAAELTGVPEATLRAWERRYGVISPARTESGYRLYDEQALACVRQMRQLLAAGWAPRQAAARVREAMPVGEASGTDLQALVTPFLDAARRLDQAALDDVLDQVFLTAPFEVAVDAWLVPTLQELGVQWAEGDLSIASEHFAAAALLRRLHTAFESARSNVNGPRIVVGLGPGSRHELGMLAFATAARRAGLDVRYLGPDLPADEWVRAVHGHDVAAAVLSVPLPTDVSGADLVVAALHAAEPNLVIAVGGTYQDEVASPAMPLGHSICEATRTLADALAARTTKERSA